MRLNDALSQIADIRQQIARSQSFNGYRSMTTGLTGVLAIVAAAVQREVVPVDDAIHHMNRYLTIWLIAALVSIVIVGVELAIRCFRSDQPLQREMSFHAIEQMTPSLVAGALLTYVITQFAGEIAWILPGIWSILFGLGVFASRRLLPKATFLVGGFYLLAGLYMISMHYKALAGWTMGATFGLVQIAAAALLYFTLERQRERTVKQ
jgi:ABC-type proline/glycine betaine transport system permease subunit